MANLCRLTYVCCEIVSPMSQKHIASSFCINFFVPAADTIWPISWENVHTWFEVMQHSLNFSSVLFNPSETEKTAARLLLTAPRDGPNLPVAILLT